MEDDGGGLAVWNGLLAAALRIPGARVDRAEFLRSALGHHVGSAAAEAAARGTPAKARIPRGVISKVAEGAIQWHRAGVSATSAVAGLPGGFWVAGTVPLDLAQYFWHVLVVLQKLAYLHGWPSLMQEDEDIDEETKLVLTLFVGVMMGVQGASNALSKLATAVGSEAARRLPRASLTKYALVQLAKTVAKWIGFGLTKKKIGELLGRAMPVVGGLVAGAMTWSAFGKGATRLHEHLRSLPLAAE